MTSLPLVNFVPVHQVSTITAAGQRRRGCPSTPGPSCIGGFNLGSSIIFKGFYVHRFLLILRKLFVDRDLSDANQAAYNYYKSNL